MAKKKDNTAEIGFEEQIWSAADKLRGNIDASEYKNVVLGLIFLKYISDKFDQKYQELVEEGEGFEEDRDEYASENIFFVPESARWKTIAAAAHTPEIGKVIDEAMRQIEAENNKLKGIEMNSGSLGHGLPVAVGMALAGKMDGRDYRVYTIMGDGELAEGSVWEGAMSGGNYQLDNLCALVDRNRLQISGSTEDVMKQDSQEERWAAFGWNVLSIPGNDVRAIDAALTLATETCGKPTVIILNTVKGYGSPVMEDKAAWHHHLPNDEEYAQIIADFAAHKEAING